MSQLRPGFSNPSNKMTVAVVSSTHIWKSLAVSTIFVVDKQHGIFTEWFFAQSRLDSNSLSCLLEDREEREMRNVWRWIRHIRPLSTVITIVRSWAHACLVQIGSNWISENWPGRIIWRPIIFQINNYLKPVGNFIFSVQSNICGWLDWILHPQVTFFGEEMFLKVSAGRTERNWGRSVIKLFMFLNI